MFNKAVFAVCILSLTLAGCSSFKKVTGQTNDTILPGPREDVLPPDQTTARDPNIVGGQPAPGGAIQQQTLAQPNQAPQPNMPQTAQKGDLLPANSGTVVTCDPLVQTCPGMTPPAPTKPVVAAKPPAGKVIVAAKTKQPAAGAAQTPAVETVGTDPMKPEAKAARKIVNKKKKKLVLKPKPTDPAAPATPGDAPQAPPPLVAPDAKTQ